MKKSESLLDNDYLCSDELVFVKAKSCEENVISQKRVSIYNEYDNLQHMTKERNAIVPTTMPVTFDEEAQKQLKDKTNQNSKFSMSFRKVFRGSGSTSKVEVTLTIDILDIKKYFSFSIQQNNSKASELKNPAFNRETESNYCELFSGKKVNSINLS
jgi:hypothetical protein